MSALDRYKCEGQMSIFDLLSQNTWSGKTSPAHFQAPEEVTKEKISKRFSQKSSESSKQMPPMFLYLKTENGRMPDVLWESETMDSRFPLPTDYTMRSFGEYPSEEKESLLSQILEEHPLQKYSLSARACQGILNRAERRGKTLPPILKETLEKQALAITDGMCNQSTSNQRMEPLKPSTQENAEAVVENPTSCNPSAFKNEPENQGGVKESSSKENEQEPSQPSITKTYCLQGNGIDRADTAGCNGSGWREGASYTLNTIDRHAVCVSQDAYDKYSESDKSATIKQSGGVYGGGYRSSRDSENDRPIDGEWISEERHTRGNERNVYCAKVVGTLCARDYKGVGHHEAEQGKLIAQDISQEMTPTA